MNGIITVVQTATQIVGLFTSIKGIFGGGKETREVVYKQDPVLLEMLREMEASRSDLLSNLDEMKRQYNDFILGPLQRETAAAAAELAELRARLDQAEKEAEQDFNNIVQTATDIVCQAMEPVDVLLGALGSGKSTIANLMFGLTEANPGQSFSHVTTKNQVLRRSNGQRPMVDTVGHMPDAKGMIRVLSCIFYNGMSPEGLIVVHNERVGSLHNRLLLLGANEVNSLSFDPRSFWRDHERAEGVELTHYIFKDPSPEVSHVNQIANASSPVKPSDLRARLIHAFATIDYESFKSSAHEQHALSGIVFYFAKTLMERKNYRGSDLSFIDRI